MSVIDLVRGIASDILRPTFVDEHDRRRKSGDIASRLVGVPSEIADYVRKQARQDEVPNAAVAATTAPADDGFRSVLKATELADGESKVVATQAGEIALFRLNGRFFATTNICPHAAGPIGEGQIEGNCVTCPYHGWTFDIPTGECVTLEGEKLRTFPTERRGDDILVKLG